LSCAAAWHVDPDRRATGRRVTQAALYEPSAEAIDELRRQSAHAAVKLAPAADVPPHWAEQAELEWIGHHRQCQQLVAWFGSLAQTPGRRRATVLSEDGSAAELVGGSDAAQLPVAERIGRYLFDPHAAVLAAKLVGSLARRHALAAVASRSVYLTADGSVADPLLACFEVQEVLPWDVRRVLQALRRRGVQRVDVKSRGARGDAATSAARVAADLSRKLGAGRNVTGGEATVVITRVGGRTVAIIARRVSTASAACDPGVAEAAREA
jgi:hypothetical protein